MTKNKAEYLDEFRAFVARVRNLHDLIRRRPEFGPNTDAGHFINENTLIRIDEELDFIRQELPAGQRDWLSLHNGKEGFAAYVTMRVYPNLVVHNRGRLNQDFDNSSRYATYRADYESFCRGVQVRPLKPGEKLDLPVQQPGFLLGLVDGVEEFAQQVLGTSPAQSPPAPQSTPPAPAGSHTSVQTSMLGPNQRGKP